MKGRESMCDGGVAPAPAAAAAAAADAAAAGACTFIASNDTVICG